MRPEFWAILLDAGNPIVTATHPWTRLSEDRTGPRRKTFTHTHLEIVQRMKAKTPGCFTDIDTPNTDAALGAREQEIAT